MREQPEVAWPATAGAVLSSIATIAELGVVLWVTNRSVLWNIRSPLIATGVVAAAYGAIFTFRTLNMVRLTRDKPSRIGFQPESHADPRCTR